MKTAGLSFIAACLLVSDNTDAAVDAPPEAPSKQQASLRMLEVLRTFQQAPRSVSRKEVNELLFALCGSSLRAESIREELPLLFPMEYLPQAVAAGCGTLVLADGTVHAGVIAEEGAFAPNDEPGLTEQENSMAQEIAAPFDLLAGPLPRWRQ